MLWTKTHIPTLREDPADAEIISHKLLVRAGYIRKLTAGIYNYLPLMQRTLHRVENIVRQEMNVAGAIEITMPVLHPAELWQKTGRWDTVGKEQMRMRDRHQHDMVLGGTHEEVVTWIARGEVRSYRQLPLNLYQIQVKFRDEIRPRFGLMRGREFTMKDAYSFDVDEAGLKIAYRKMAEAYFKIFRRCGFDVKMVESDVGAMGGFAAHEFMVPVETAGGEETILSCSRCDYAANIEKAISVPLTIPKTDEEPRTKELVFTPGMKTIEEVTSFLKQPAEKLVKTMIYLADAKPVAVLIRGDRTINETKLKNHLRCLELEMADPSTIMRLTGAQVGFTGPIGLDNVPIIADPEIKSMVNFVVGANKDDSHIINVNLDDFRIDEYVELRRAEAGEVCPRCGTGHLEAYSGIEVGNLFMLGTKYSEALGAYFVDKDGQERPFVMGSYGIGITRTAQAAVEAFHDDKGIIWPKAIAPYDLHIIPLNMENDQHKQIAFSVMEKLENAGYSVILDDRNERPGVKFNDADLIGMPVRIAIGDKGLKEGIVEIVRRKDLSVEKVPIDNTAEKAIEIFKEL
ncbi:MAG: proline--tRNA ligase [candidate division Zixibacteria bacterium 4484_95]|nr:MAG: proline--tRNA ligase [candidate division Zixibacteria bacterium 4484_95]